MKHAEMIPSVGWRVSFQLTDPFRIVSRVGIGTPKTFNPKTGADQVTTYGRPFTAVWDTGAPFTVAVPRVIQTASLKQRGFRPTRGIDGGPPRLRPVYPACIWMSSDNVGPTFCFTDVVMLERDDQLGKCDLLIGMDIMGSGDIGTEWRDGGTLWFTFCSSEWYRPPVENTSRS